MLDFYLKQTFFLRVYIVVYVVEKDCETNN